MDYVVLGGDARMPALASLLRRRGFDARYVNDADQATEMLPEARRIVTQWPPKLNLSKDEVLSLAPESAMIYLCGPDRGGDAPRIIDLWADEALKRDNAALTAEGAVSAAMRASRVSLRDMNCMVIGWGRIGSALTELLVAVGARVTVVSRSMLHRHHAIQRGAEAIGPDKLPVWLRGMSLVFSTPPAMVLDRALLGALNREAMVIDLASPPYGVDLIAAWDLGIRAWREPGLPGRYCPVSAAGALLKAMDREATV